MAVQRRGQRDGIEVSNGSFLAAFDEARIAQRGQRCDDSLELGDAGFEVGATRIFRNRWVQLRRFHGH